MHADHIHGAHAPHPAVGAPSRRRLLKGLPVEARRREANGTATAVLEGGQGPPVVLLHGGIACGGAYWAPVLSRLAERHRLIVPDVPGLGASEPLARLDGDDFADWLTALLRPPGGEKPVLVAHSLTGTLAARFAARHGGLLRGLVLYGAPGVGPYRLPLGLRAAAVRLDLWPTARSLDRFERWPFLDPERTRRRDAAWFDAFNAYLLALGAVPHVRRTLRQLLGPGTRPVPEADLRRVPVPVTLVWGRHDRMTPLRLAEGAHARLGWPLRVVEGAGHVPHIEQPEAFLEALRPALAGPVPGRASPPAALPSPRPAGRPLT